MARPVRLYAALEAGVAVLGVLSTLALARSAAPFVELQDAVGPLAWALPFALVGLPAFLMGGTLPALLRSLQPGPDAVAPATGLLYAANTAGAVLGTLATPFLLVPAFGIQGTGFFAAALGLAVSGAALVLDRRMAVRAAVTPLPAETLAPGALRDARFALALYAVAGGVALGYEVVWSEVLVQFLSTRSYAFAVMLATYLSGLALGSYLFARFGGRGRDPWRMLGVLLAGAGASALAIVALLGAWLPDAQTFAGMWAMRATGSETVEVGARFAVAAAVVLLVPTMFLGAAFPAAARLIARAHRVAGDVGTTAAFNTAGGIAGTLLTGFVLVPVAGARPLARVPGRGGGAARRGRGAEGRRAPRRRDGDGGGRPGPGAHAARQAGHPAGREAGREARLLRRRHRRDGGRARAGGGRRTLPPALHPGRLELRRRADVRPLHAPPGPPAAAHPRWRAAQRAGRGLRHRHHGGRPPRRSRARTRGSWPSSCPPSCAPPPPSRATWARPPTPRLEIRIGDGRQELLRRSQRYDLITLEPPPPSAAGVVNLYSRDFYELCRSRLQPGGLMAQWWPLPAQNDEDSRSLVRSFLDVFPHATAWSTELHEVLLVGSASPIDLDGERVTARFSQPAVRAALAEVGIESPEALLATWVTDRAGLERFAGDAAPVTDDRPLIEHAAWVRRGELQRVLPRLLALATDPPLRPGDPLRPAVEAERRELLAFYRYSLHAMAGERDEAGAALREVLARDPRNPYYLWVAYGRQ